MRKLKMNDVYLLKFVCYGGISAYDYSIKSDFTLLWVMLSIMVISFWIVGEIKDK